MVSLHPLIHIDNCGTGLRHLRPRGTRSRSVGEALPRHRSGVRAEVILGEHLSECGGCL